MLDLKRIRNNPEDIKKALNDRGENFDLSIIDTILELDEERRQILMEVETLKGKRNQVSASIPQLKKAGQDVELIMKEMRELGDKIKEFDVKVFEIDEKVKYMMLRIPNIPNSKVPDGKSDEDNIEVKKWSDATKFNFEPKPHWDIASNLDIIDFERASKVTYDIVSPI